VEAVLPGFAKKPQSTRKERRRSMDGSYFGEPNMGNERVSGSSSSSSSRKGKKNNQEKPKQPQRGLGVAQLEKIRLHGQMACGAYHPPLQAPYPSNFNNVRPFSSFSKTSNFYPCTKFIFKDTIQLKNYSNIFGLDSEFQYWEVLLIPCQQHAGRSKGANTLFISTIIIFFLLLLIYIILSFIWLPTQHCGMCSFAFSSTDPNSFYTSAAIIIALFVHICFIFFYQ